jgi:hypothetical protein
MMYQAFTFEPISEQEYYVYIALTGIDWAKAKGTFSRRLILFTECMNRDMPKLHDKVSGQDRCFWRRAYAYLIIISCFLILLYYIFYNIEWSGHLRRFSSPVYLS